MSEAQEEARAGSAPTTAAAADAPAVIVVDVNEPLDIGLLLADRGAPFERQRLAPADYVIGPIGIERKTVGDFHASMIDKRLFEQLARLKETYPTAALLVEGDLAFFEERRSPRASWGALVAIALDMGVTLLPTPSKSATADVLDLLARRVGRAAGGSGGGRDTVRFKPRLLGPHAEQKFVVQGLPGIGDVVSDALLEHFGSLRRLFAASEKELQRTPGVGKGRARDITELLDRSYERRQRRLKRDG